MTSARATLATRKTALSCAFVTDGINSKTVPFVDPLDDRKFSIEPVRREAAILLLLGAAAYFVGLNCQNRFGSYLGTQMRR